MFLIVFTKYGPVLVDGSSDNEPKEDRPCDGKHCAGCLCNGFCDLKDSFEDENGW